MAMYENRSVLEKRAKARAAFLWVVHQFVYADFDVSEDGKSLHDCLDAAGSSHDLTWKQVQKSSGE